MGTTPKPDSPNADLPAERGDARATGPAKASSTTAARYGAMNWVGEFTCKPGVLTRRAARVVVQTDRGIELGQQLELYCVGCPDPVSQEQARRYIENSGVEFYRLSAGRVLREATPQDIDENYRLNAHANEDIQQCALLAAECNLRLKVVAAEHLLGGERIVFYFLAEGRIDFRELVRELAHRYRTRIEMRQVGARDEARLVADWEVCGRECCCKNFLKNLRPVNMRMAKSQKSTLDPSKVSGRCGRLRCCLRYEHEGYMELAAKLPRKGSRVATASAEGTVIDCHTLTQLVVIRRDDQRDLVVPLDEITAFDLPKPPPPPEPLDEEPAPEEPAEPKPEKPKRVRRRRPPRAAPLADQRRPAAPPAGTEPQAPRPPEVRTNASAPEAPHEPAAPAEPGVAGAPGPPPKRQPPTAESSRPPRRRRRRRSKRSPDDPPADHGT